MKFHPPKQPAGAVPDIAILNRQRARNMDLESLKKIATATLAELKIEVAELGIVLVGPGEMASLNQRFLGHEGATDVITFEYNSPGFTIHRPQSAALNPKGMPLHGEIFVCISEAERQAKIFGTDWRSEVVRYIIHGILHLTGYDDLQPLARKKMKAVEGRLLRKVSSLH
jgi:probable rRNA maturation factor